VSLFSENSVNNEIAIDFEVEEIQGRFLPLSGLAMAENASPWFRNNPHGYKVKTVVDQILQYLTDGELKLRSDILDTAPIPYDAYTITLSADALNPGDIVNLNITDYFQNNINASFEATANTLVDRTADLVRWAKAVIYASNRLGSVPALANAVRSGQDRFVKPFGIAECTSSGRTLLTILAYAPLQSVTATSAGSVTLTVTKTLTYTKGLKDLMIMKGEEWLKRYPADATEVYLSFSDVMKVLNASFNLQYQFEYDSGEDQWYLRLEPMEYFFTTPGTPFNFVNVPNPDAEFDTDRVASGIQLGQNYKEDTWYLPGMFNLYINAAPWFTWLNKWYYEDSQIIFDAFNFSDCGQGVYEMTYPLGYTFAQAGQINQCSLPPNYSNSNTPSIQEKMFLMDCQTIVAFPPYRSFRKYNVQTVEAVAGVQTMVNNYIYNANYSAWHFLMWHYFGLPSPIAIRPKAEIWQLNLASTAFVGTSSTGAKQALTVDANNNFLKFISFDYPISPTDFATITQTGEVEYEGQSAYLKKITYYLAKGLAKVELMINV
jgi:hypothetical protein